MLTSIRNRLLVLLLVIISLIGGITMFYSYYDAQHEVEELFDAQLAQSSRSLQAIVLHNIKSIDNFSAQEILDYPIANRELSYDSEYNLKDGHSYERKMAFQLWESPDRLVLRSASAPIIPLDITSISPENRGFSDVTIKGEVWRVFSLWDKDYRYLIQVGERYAIREELTSEIVEKLLLPSLSSIPILALMIWFGIGRGLSPIRKVAKEVTRRDPTHLEPIKIDPVPMEIRPLVVELNALFNRLHYAIEKERRFTDDAAHELRTPLAALKIHAQVASAAKNDTERSLAIKKIIAGVDRSSHLVQQMLVLARLGAGDKNKNTTTPINIHSISEELIAQLALRAIEKNINLSFQCDGNYTIYGEVANFEILLTNILNNAINYTPNDGKVEIKINNVGNSITLSVTDTGPGISDKDQERVFERYFRVRTNVADGCGLGLTISKQCADQLNAIIEFVKPKNNIGLLVNIYFPNYSEV